MNTPDEAQNDILIIDDTPKNLTVLRQILTNNNYRVHPVLSGELALDIVQRTLPDLILLDIVMPGGIDGYEVCRRLKAAERSRDIPVIFVSALDGTADKIRAFEVGGVDYISKPFRAEEVLARVETHLSLQNVRKQLQRQNIQLQQEISERTRTEKLLRESEERFRGLSEATFEGIIFHDAGVILDVNQAVIELFGYERADVIGKNIFRFLTPESREPAELNMRTESQIPYEVEARKKDGSTFAIEVQGKTMPFPLHAPFTEHARTGRVIAVRDIRRRKKAEETLRRLKKAIETTGVGITITDDEGKIIYTNPADAQMHGYRIPELVGQPSNIFTIPDSRQDLAQHGKFEDRVNWERERVNMRKDGSVFPVKLTSSPIHDTQKFRIGTVTVCEDISERKKSEDELKRAKEAAEAANRAKSIFLANMSHELRTPLNAILGFTQILRQRSAAPQEEQQEYLNIIMRSGEHLLTLIDQVLDLSKIEAGHVALDAKEFDLHRLLKLLEDMFSFKARDKDIHLSFTRSADVPRVIRSDELKLRQTLINLLNNAIKFTIHGNVQVAVRRDQLFFESGDLDADDCLLVCDVSDTGPGIAPEEMKHLFEAFVQTETGRQQQEGTGLGLSISRKFAQLLGGDIRVKSEPGKGSTFTLEIQAGLVERSADNSPQTIREKHAVSLEPGHAQYRMLVVDDKADSRKLLVALLRPFGFEVREANDGRNAIHVWEQWEPHVIFMDLRMPILDGLEAARHIKSTPQGQQTIVIMLSAGILDEDRIAVLRAGCDAFVRKPFRDTEIFDLLATLLGLRFLYKDDNALGDETTAQAVSEAFTVEALRALPVELCEDLEFAATTSDLPKMLALSDKIYEYNPELAESLETLIKDFEYTTILTALQQLK